MALLGGNACAAPALPSPEVVDLQPVAVPNTIVLPIQSTEFIKGATWALADNNRTYFAGRYTADKENALGTFYLAENFAFANSYRRHQFHLMRGGFWLPKSGEFKPRHYELAGGRPMIVDSIAGLSPEALKASAAEPKPLVVNVSSAVALAGVNIAGGIVSALVEAEYAKPLRVVMMGPVTDPETLKALSEAVAQSKPVEATPAIPATPENQAAPQ